MEYKSQHTSATPTDLTFELLERATNNFSEDHIVGSGRLGVVYKGILEDGQEIAVKKLRDGQQVDTEAIQQNYNRFMDIHHPNIVRLFSCCQETRYKRIKHKGEVVIARLDEIALCSEYLLGGSLDKHVSDESRGHHWHTRYKIIKGICEGLHHLHNSRDRPIFHKNLNLTNILLDNNMVAKIGDLETSMIRMELEDHIKGTMRYLHLPPEYIDSGLISKKMDVFSLGVIIIQIMTGDDAHEKYTKMPPQEFIELVHENWRKRFQTTMLFPSASHEVRTCIRIALMCVERNRHKRPTISDIVHELDGIDMGHRTREFTFSLLDHITNHFSSEHELGRGGFGVVYKGILDDGEEIAVKKLKSIPLLDDHQFNNELNNLKTLEHPNIVRLVGYCHDTTLVNVEHNGRVIRAAVEERALCYEYLEEGSLDKYLSDESCGFDWHARYKIIRGISAGLHYLQKGSKHPIYHLDLKPANILLDKDMMPKIGDFGLSRLFDSIQTYLTQSQNSPGTPGYMPPEYIDGHQISPKFDIFSFGVIIIQIMIGKNGRYSYATVPPKEFSKLVQEKWKKRMPEAMSPHTSEEVMTCIELALRCVDTNREKRPSITEIIDELNNIGTTKSTPKVQAAHNKVEEPNLFVSYASAHKGSYKVAKSYDANDTSSAYTNAATYNRLGKYKTVATDTKGPEYDVTSEPLDHELVMISGEGRKHGTEVIGHGMFSRSSRRTLPEINSQQTSSSTSMRKCSTPTMVEMEARLAEERRQAAERLAEERRLADERLQQALSAQTSHCFDMFAAWCTQQGMPTMQMPGFTPIAPHPSAHGSNNVGSSHAPSRSGNDLGGSPIP